jgi:hypothetical protein
MFSELNEKFHLHLVSAFVFGRVLVDWYWARYLGLGSLAWSYVDYIA